MGMSVGRTSVGVRHEEFNMRYTMLEILLRYSSGDVELILDICMELDIHMWASSVHRWHSKALEWMRSTS